MIWAVSLSTTNLIARSLTATLSLTGIRSLVDVSNLVGPISHPVLYLRQEPRDAAPKCISGRTSYHRVCLAFHPYPQLIPQVFNPGGFGPPRRLTGASPWPWVDHPASGLEHATTHALFGLAFATATPHGLTSPRTANSQAHSSKGTPSQDTLALTACRHTVSGTISLPSRGTFHLSLTVLVRYRSPGSIQAYQVVLADSHEISRAPCYSEHQPTRRRAFAYRGLT